MTNDDKKINELEQQTRILKDIKKLMTHVTQWLAAIVILMILFGVEKFLMFMKFASI